MTETVSRAEFERAQLEATHNTQLLQAVIRTNERLTDAMERMVGLDAKLTEVQKGIVDLQESQHSQKARLAELMAWRNNRKAVEGALGWMLDKGPTLGGIAIVMFWVLDNWGKK